MDKAERWKRTRMSALVNLKGPHCPKGWAQTLPTAQERKQAEPHPCALVLATVVISISHMGPRTAPAA